TGFEIQVPMKISSRINATINKMLLEVDQNIIDNITRLNFRADNLSIDLSKDTILEISFETNELIQSAYGIRYLYIPGFETNFDLTTIEYTINYPQSFPEIS